MLLALFALASTNVYSSNPIPASPSLDAPSNPNVIPPDLNRCASPNPSFIDVPSGNQYYEAIIYLACRGFVAGYGNGYFGINDPVKRGQYTKMVDLPLRWAYPSSAPNPPSFNDIANSVFRLNIEQAYYKQVISGYADCNPS